MRTIATFVVGFTLLGCGGSVPENAAPVADEVGAKEGLLAPDFSLTSLDGETVRLSEAVAVGPVVLMFGSYS